jgi:transcriptional regulator with XRE-family HTH domain
MRRRIGGELKKMRDAAGKKIEDAAQALDCSTAKISRLENGKGVPRWRDVRDLIHYYEAGEREDLLNLVETARVSEVDWFDSFQDVTQDESFARYLDLDSSGQFVYLERDAGSIQTYEAALIPGLVQTDEYAEAVCSIIYPQQSDKQRLRFVEFRLARQKALLGQENRPVLSVVLSEAAILRRIGGPKVMLGQLEALLRDLDDRLSAVDFRVIPLAENVRGAFAGAFTIMRFADPLEEDVVHLEGLDDTHYLRGDPAVPRYEAFFAELQGASLSRADSIARITEVVAKLR